MFYSLSKTNIKFRISFLSDMKISLYYFIYLIPVFLLSFSDSHTLELDIKNFHKVSDDLYRSAQPNKKEMKLLEESGIKSVINLRSVWGDKNEVRKTKLKDIHIPMRAKKVDYTDILNTMVAFRDAPKPMLVHCRRGSDRTGCMVAIYRIVFQGWSKEKAINDFRNPEYGYLENLFPNLVEIIEGLDIEQLNNDLNKR